MQPLPVDRTFDPLSNDMHNSFLTEMSLRTLKHRSDEMINICWHFNIYKQDKFRTQLS